MISAQKLFEHLQAMQSLLDQLLTILEKQRTAITGLDTITAEKLETTLSENLLKIDPLNHEISTALTAAYATEVVSGDKSLGKLAALLPKAEQEFLIKLQLSVRFKADAVNNALTVNRNLLQDSLHFTNQSLQLFTKALRQTSSSTYGQQGRFVDAPEQPHIICKEI